MTRWFVLPKFGSKEPSPRWGGHKDRVSFNHFPLSNGHLDWVSFLPWFPRSLRPRKDHHTIGVSCFAYKALRIRMRERRKPTKQQRNTRTILSQVRKQLNWRLWLDRWLWFVSWSVALCSCIEWRVLNAWMVEVVVVEGYLYPSPTKTTVGAGCCRWAHRTVRRTTEHCPVCQPRLPIVRVLTQSTVGALTSSGTGQSGAAPDNYCSLSGAPLTSLWLLPRTVALSGALCSRPLRRRAIAPVAHRTVRWIIAERHWKNPRVASLDLYGPGAPDTVRWHTGQSDAPN
jgi:hypothetical protein